MSEKQLRIFVVPFAERQMYYPGEEQANPKEPRNPGPPGPELQSLLLLLRGNRVTELQAEGAE